MSALQISSAGEGLRASKPRLRDPAAHSTLRRATGCREAANGFSPEQPLARAVDEHDLLARGADVFLARNYAMKAFIVSSFAFALSLALPLAVHADASGPGTPLGSPPGANGYNTTPPRVDSGTGVGSPGSPGFAAQPSPYKQNELGRAPGPCPPSGCPQPIR